MQFNVYEITEDRYLRYVETDSISPKWLTDENHRWIDLAEFQKHDLEALLAPLDLNSEILDACLVPQSRPRVITLEQILFVSIPVQADKDNLCYLTLLGAPTTLITIQHSEILYMDDLASCYLHDRRLIAANTAGLVFELVDRSLRKISSASFSLRDEVVVTAQMLEDDVSAINIDVIMNLAREATQIEILFQDQQYCLSELLSGRSESLALETICAASTSLVADLDRAQFAVGRLQDQIRDLHQYHLHNVEEATNRRLNMLTLLSAIYLPPTLLTGIYGMGFDNIPVIGMRHGYAIVMLLMITLVLGQLAFFRWRGWFQ